MSAISDGGNELHKAVLQKNVKSVRRVLRAKKKARLQLTAFDDYGQTPLTVALKNNDQTLTQILLDYYSVYKADVNLRDKNGFTLLHHAVSCTEELLQLILNHPDIDVTVKNEDENTALHYFCQNYKSPSLDAAFNLFMKKGADLNAQNSNGESLLHKAVFNNSVRLLMVDVLLKQGASVNVLNNRDETPLHYAVYLGRHDLVSVLIKHFADPFICGSVGKSAIDLATDEGNERIITILQNTVELENWLKTIGLEKYKNNFVKEGFSMRTLSSISEKTLDKMGIESAGSRLKILKACRKIEVPDKRESISPDTSDLASTLQTLRPSSTSDDGSWLIPDSELEFTEKLGSGSSGKVYKGLMSGKVVAVKILKAMTEQKEVEEFKAEFEVMSALTSPWTVKFYGACLNPRLCMVMEYCDRGSLYHVMTNDTYELKWEKILKMSIEIVNGMNVLHSAATQIVHRDLKSLNLLVNNGWEIKVCDFGLSRFNTGSNLETMSKMRGTLAYCAPEIYFGDPFTHKSDVYSIGIVLWELVTRTITGAYEKPYENNENINFDFQIIIQAAKNGLRPSVPPTCPKIFSDLIEICLLGDPNQRPDCTVLLNKLTEIQKNYTKHKKEWKKAILSKNCNEAANLEYT